MRMNLIFFGTVGGTQEDAHDVRQPLLAVPGRPDDAEEPRRAPPHGHLVSSLWGTDRDADGHIEYWRKRTHAGWVDGVSAHVRNSLVPGFEPTGVGAITDGHFRAPYFVDRVGRLAETLHVDDTRLTVQMILQGGMPHGPSPVLSGPVVNLVPHPLTVDEIDYFVEEYRFGASRVKAAGGDGVELHLNHDDMLEWFISPLTNHREDEYGGTVENRLRFPTRILQAVREEVGPEMVVGVRLNLREEEPGGYDVAGAIEIARHFESAGLVDFLSCAIGSPWGSPSYIQSHHHRRGEWSALDGQVRDAVSVPVMYTGRVTSPADAERILADGHADLVGMARAHIADGDLLAKAREGREEEIRPCVGGNECISRRIVENLSFSCAVNPATGRREGLRPTSTARRVLVIDGGPAGLELAGLAAERGHDSNSGRPRTISVDSSPPPLEHPATATTRRTSPGRRGAYAGPASESRSNSPRPSRTSRRTERTWSSSRPVGVLADRRSPEPTGLSCISATSA
jgi:2,4-dienoyl-CoA reductase-like NADH-dependent reductase (Old Yellow Enzyme family)